MKIDRRITNGLAWAGALLVVAIPTADFITRQFMPETGANVAVVGESAVKSRPVANAPAAPAPSGEATQVAANPADPVGSYLQAGKKLPDYITGGGDAPVAKPATPAPAPATPAAQPAPAKPAPVTQPQASATPPAASPAAPAQVQAPASTAAVGFPTPVSERPPSVATANLPIVLPGQSAVSPNQQIIRPAQPALNPTFVPPSTQRVIRPEELDGMEEWEAGPLNDYLARQQGSRATVRRQQIVPPSAIVPPANVGGGSDYVPGGFFLDQSPGSQQPSPYERPYDGGFIPEYEVYPLN